ncbi:hypothetical protein KCP76_19275 [Salmonella enterica subsp. enterica serovar Weltevreden]|nr:hypothetical protein KCP76_19275 [Salmonella enterica subsp. enterica serovar Weltevreden]
MRWHNLTPEGVILKSRHLDHRGGLRSLQQECNQCGRSPLGWRGHCPVSRREQWQ